MLIPLVILAVLSLGGGFINIPHFLEPIFPLAEEENRRAGWSTSPRLRDSAASRWPISSMCSRRVFRNRWRTRSTASTR